MDNGNIRYSTMLSRMAYLQLDIEEFNDLLKINNICIDSNILKVLYKLKVNDNGIALYDECKNSFAINYTQDLGQFLKDYTCLNGLSITTDMLDKIIYTLNKILALKTKRFEGYIKSFSNKYMAENYIEISSFKINDILENYGKTTVYLIEDLGVKLDKDIGVTHELLIAEMKSNTIKSFKIVDIHRGKAASIGSICNIDNTKAIRFASTILPEFEHKIIKKMVIAYNMLSDQRIDEICNNINLLSRSENYKNGT